MHQLPVSSLHTAMHRFVSSSVGPPTTAITSDLDGLTFSPIFPQSNAFAEHSDFDSGFGFDPSAPGANLPLYITKSPTADEPNTPDEAERLAGWPGITSYELRRLGPQSASAKQDQSYQQRTLSQQRALHMSSGRIASSGPLHRINTTNVPDVAVALSQYGQITPPRSNSAESSAGLPKSNLPAIAGPPPRRRRGKSQGKVSMANADAAASVAKPRKAPGRKRGSTTQSSPGTQEDERRRASLEKNRVAAAKCRVNKKDKTEQLQRDSHNKAAENAMLRNTIADMESEVQTLGAYLVAHANCTGCNDEKFKDALKHLEERFFVQQYQESRVAPLAFMTGSPAMQRSDSNHSIGSGYYSLRGTEDGSPISHPPLPEFNLAADFDVRTPPPDCR